MDPISLAVGAGILAFGVPIGYVMGWRAALRRRNRPEPPQQPICGCRHHRSLHDPNTLRCMTTVQVQLYDDRNFPAGKERVPCACQRYVGPEPITSFWTPPIAAEESDR